MPAAPATTPIAPPELAPPGFAPADWAGVAVYLGAVAVTGYLFARSTPKDAKDYFLAGRRLPAWAVAISIVATSLSAVTFIGAPELSFTGDLTYLSTNLGMILAAIVIALLFIPRFYRTDSASIYEHLETTSGPGARRAASTAFLLGRLLASGARVYAASIPAALIIVGPDKELTFATLAPAILTLTVVATAYTLWGGIASVIWSDVIQYVVLMTAALAAIAIMISIIDAPFPDVLAALRTGNAGQSKLTLIDPSFDLTASFALPACLIGYVVLGIGSYGTDQDLAQRMLTCKDAKEGAKSVISGILIAIPTVAVFLTVGLLLWIVYTQPQLTSEQLTRTGRADVRVFLDFILTRIPTGIKGLMIAGLFAAGLSSMNSAINAMSAAFVSDLYRPLRPGHAERHYVTVGRLGVLIAGLLLGAFALLCIPWRNASGYSLIDFALGVMGFAYAGLVGVFLCVILTKRGSTTSAIAALAIGFAFYFGSQRVILDLLIPETDTDTLLARYRDIHYTWKLTLGAMIAFAVCALGPQRDPATIAAPRDA